MSAETSRREFLKAGAILTAGAGVLKAGVASGQASTTESVCSGADVIVVGAGFAGMVAAYRLMKAGRSVIVMDAQNRVGGRSWSTTLSDGTFLDIGAGWTGSTEFNILRLISELGLTTYPTYGLVPSQGSSIFVGADGKVARFTGLNFPISPTGKKQVFNAIGTIDLLADTIPLEAPWKAARADEFDRISAGVFAEQTISDPEALKVVLENLTTVLCLSPYAVSFLQLLWATHSAGGVERFGQVPGGWAELRIVGGTQQIPIRIAQCLTKVLGEGSIVLNNAVRGIEQSDAGVKVMTDQGIYQARRVICAVATSQSGFIRYHPILPADRAQLIQRYPQGSVMKLQLVYDRAFWRDNGLTGNSFAADDSFITQTVDAGGPAGKPTPGIMCAFADDDKPREMGRMTRDQRKAIIMKELTPRFGSRIGQLSKRITPNYIEFISEDLELIRGDYAGQPGPHVLTGFGFGPAVRAPFGRIHWAGVDTATIWMGTINGAAQSGERAANEVVRAGL
jgi:monoamine oxidase